MCHDGKLLNADELKKQEPVKTKLILLTLAIAASHAQAALYITNWNTGFANNGHVPDSNLAGWSDTRSVAASGTICMLIWSTMPASLCC